MEIQVNTDITATGRDALADHAKGRLGKALRRFEHWVTRVETHITDEHSNQKGAEDKRCVTEAHIKGHEPIAVMHHAATFDQAIKGATEKLKTALGRTVGRLRKRR